VLSTGNFDTISNAENPLENILLELGLTYQDEINFKQFKSLLSKFIEDEKVMQSLTQA
jgi:hypothetical protein